MSPAGSAPWRGGRGGRPATVTQARAASRLPGGSGVWSTYPLIADHGLIGDLHTAALVTTDGEIDWFCSPRFDSPSVFASLLDPERGGRFRLAPAEPGYVSKQLYFPGSAVLITRFMTPGGVGRSAISCRCRTAGRADNHRLVRIAASGSRPDALRVRVRAGVRLWAGRPRARFDRRRAVFRARERQLTMRVSGRSCWIRRASGCGARMGMPSRRRGRCEPARSAR